MGLCSPTRWSSSTSRLTLLRPASTPVCNVSRVRACLCNSTCICLFCAARMAASQGETCQLVATWMKICRQDFACVVGIAFFVLYVLFGVTPTLKGIEWCRKKFTGRAKREQMDVEDPEQEYDGHDQHHSHTNLLKRFISRYSDAHTAVPPTTYFPTLSESSPQPPTRVSCSRSVPLCDSLQEHMRFARFQFPKTRRGPAPLSTPLPALTSTSTRSSQCSTDTDLETLDDLVLGAEVQRKSIFDPSEYSPLGFEDLNEEKKSVDEAAARLPNIPPPASLNLDQQMEPERLSMTPSNVCLSRLPLHLHCPAVTVP